MTEKPQTDMEKTRTSFLEAEKKWQEEHDRIWKELTYEQRLAAADVIFRVLVDNAEEGGSFRSLIYGRLGFNTDAYAVLYCAGGMNISNNFVMDPTKEEGTDENSDNPKSDV